ncbi:MAG: serine--tRNA ligase [Patescibacteria group bacterium]
MLDIKYIREHADEVKKNCERRHSKADIDELLRVDADRLDALREVEEIRKQRNEIAEAMKSATPEDRPGLIEKGKALKESLGGKEAQLAEFEQAWTGLMLQVPNLTHPDVPEGKDDSENVEIRRVGGIRSLSNPRNHVELAHMHDLIDFERGAKVAGAKFYFLKGKLALLEQALVRFALDYLTAEGFTAMTTPDLANDTVLVGTGFQPRGPETQIYSIENTDLSLIGTAEIGLGGYHMNEMLDESVLPIKYAGLSHCFRTEAGTYGRESYGLYRVHQFTKVEMFVYCKPDQSDAMLAEILRHGETLFQKLGIPYRVVEICTGDFGNPHYRKYDIEAWMWGRGDGIPLRQGSGGQKGDWGEVTSASNCTDFQARRLNIRMKDGEEKPYVHTLNNTAIATSRAMIALLENWQNEDGSITVPPALVEYCGFERIG